MNLKTYILTACFVLAAAAGLQAGMGGCPGQGHYTDLMSGLTQEQQDRVQKLTDTHHEQLFALQKQLGAKHAEMEALFAVVPPDKAAIEASIAELNALQAKKAELNANYRILLTEITGKPMTMEAPMGRCGAQSTCAGAKCAQTPCTEGTRCGDVNCGKPPRCGAPSSGTGCGAGAIKGCPGAQGS